MHVSDANTQSSTTGHDVSVIIPVYNEAARIGASLERIWEYFTAAAARPQIIFVDDGSDDRTVSIARAYAITHPEIVVLAEQHRGKAAAVLSGLEYADGAIVGFMDVDIATPLPTFHRCRDEIERGAGVAIASREGDGADRIDEPWYRHAMGRVFNGIVRLMLLPGIHDSQCGFKFFSRSALKDILAHHRLYRKASVVTIPRVTAFDVELLFIARSHHHRIAIVPITWQYGTQSKVNPLTDTLQNLRDVLVVRINGWLGRYG